MCCEHRNISLSACSRVLGCMPKSETFGGLIVKTLTAVATFCFPSSRKQEFQLLHTWPNIWGFFFVCLSSHPMGRCGISSWFWSLSPWWLITLNVFSWACDCHPLRRFPGSLVPRKGSQCRAGSQGPRSLWLPGSMTCGSDEQQWKKDGRCSRSVRPACQAGLRYRGECFRRQQPKCHSLVKQPLSDDSWWNNLRTLFLWIGTL